MTVAWHKNGIPGKAPPAEARRSTKRGLKEPTISATFQLPFPLNALSYATRLPFHISTTAFSHFIMILLPEIIESIARYLSELQPPGVFPGTNSESWMKNAIWRVWIASLALSRADPSTLF